MNYTFRMVVGGPESDSDQSIMFRGNPYSIDEKEEDMNLYGINVQLMSKLVNESADKSTIKVSFSLAKKN